MAALRRVAGMMRTPPTSSSVYPALMKKLVIRRVGSLNPSSWRRLSHSAAAGDQPAKSPDEKLDELVEEILATEATSMPSNVVEDLFVCVTAARVEAHKKNLWKSWMVSAVLISGGIIGNFMSKKYK